VPGCGVDGCPVGVSGGVSISRGVLSSGVLGSRGLSGRGVFGASRGVRGDAEGVARGEPHGVLEGVLSSFLLLLKGRCNGPVPFEGRCAGKLFAAGAGANFTGGAGA